MATGEKPYRVYRGGRVKGRVPLERPQRRPDRNGRTPREPRVRRPRRRWSWKRRIGVTLLIDETPRNSRTADPSREHDEAPMLITGCAQSLFD